MPTDDDIGTQAFTLMKELVEITAEKWVSAARFTALADRWGLDDPAARVIFLTGVKRLMRDMPEKVFQDADARLSILNTAQEALDQAIDAEEDIAQQEDEE